MTKHKKPTGEQSDWKLIQPCLYQFREGTYYALVKRKGKQIRQSLRTTDKELAKRRLREFLNEVGDLNVDLSRETIDSFAERFLQTLRGAPSTISKRSLHVRVMLETWPKDARRELGSITTEHCKQWVANGALTYYKNSRPVKDRKLSDTALADRIDTAKAFFELAVEAKAIRENPMAKVAKPKRGDVIRLTPSEEQVQAILEDLRRQHFNGHGAADSADFVELAATLGLGQAELSNIQRQHIDLAEGVIHIRRKKSKETFEVPLFHEARLVIERRLAELSDEPTTNLLPHANCRKALEGACRRLKFPHFEPRSLRRYHITRCIRLGVDIPTIAAWQGHQDGGELILSTYSDEVKRDHSLKMAQKLAPTPANVVELPKQETA
jgi:integrase